MARTFATWGAVFGLIAVGLGAFGAHALRERMSAESMAIYQTGVQYHMIHALALLALAALSHKLRKPDIIGWLFIFGILIFSGSLYLLAISGHRWLGAITPLGGVCFLSGWAVFAWQVARSDG